MHFKPIYSFSIHRFDYDTNSHRLLVHYYDGHQSIRSDVPPIVIAVLRASSQPETILERYGEPEVASTRRTRA